MVEELGSSLEDLALGGAAETASESKEQTAARVAAAQQRIAAVKKEENFETQFDKILSQMVRSVRTQDLDFIEFLVNHEIPSLTILALFCLRHEDAQKVCNHKDFQAHNTGQADFSDVLPELPTLATSLTFWWESIFIADGMSRSTKLSVFKPEDRQDFLTFTRKFLEGTFPRGSMDVEEPKFNPADVITRHDAYVERVTTPPKALS